MNADRESLYAGEAVPSDIGRAQFIAHQSSGVFPAEPDPYYTALSIGKRLWDITLSTIVSSRFSDDLTWDGTYQLGLDFGDKPAALADLSRALGVEITASAETRRDDRPRDGTWRPEGVTEDMPFS